MTPLAPDYLSMLAGQIGNVSAFLGGFSATFLALFLTLGKGTRPAAVAVVGSALASVSFVLTVIATTMLIAVLHPHAPAGAASQAGLGRTVMSLAFFMGLVALLVSIGASGWVRSRAMGITTTAFAAAGILLLPVMLH